MEKPSKYSAFFIQKTLKIYIVNNQTQFLDIQLTIT